jgi:hypothetical protein
VIAKYAADTVGQPQALEDYWEALKSFSGLNPEVQAKQAAAYYQVLAEGASADNNLGMQIELAAEAVDLSAIGTEDDDLAVESTDYGPAIWNAADSSNYSTSRGASIDRWVNHWIGVGTYAGAISWFKNPASNVSAHFVIRKSDGQLTQMVRIAHKAWHCGNWNSRSIGIEHEATPSNPWPTDSSAPMLVVSATACRHFCNAYGMPKTRTYVGRAQRGSRIEHLMPRTDAMDHVHEPGHRHKPHASVGRHLPGPVLSIEHDRRHDSGCLGRVREQGNRGLVPCPNLPRHEQPTGPFQPVLRVR